jgi:L-threonylcarbamoyladenylate synthase
VKEAASRLFQALHELDRMGLDFIVAERVPETGLGEAVADRLRRASSPVSALREALGRKPTNNHRGLK